MSYEHMQWTIDLAGRRYLVEVAWPAIAWPWSPGQIAVNGQVVQRWRVPTNNWRASKSFEIDGVRCTLIRQRSGLISFDHQLQVGAPGALVRQLDPPGPPLAPNPYRAR